MVIAFAIRCRRISIATLLAALAAAIPALPAAPLSLREALQRAESSSPQLAAQRAAADAAAALVIPAGQNPDPKLIFGVENVPADGGDKWSLNADFMTMRRVGVMQDFVSGEKRDLREARATAESQREEAMIAMQRADLRRDVATAWFERAFAERSRALVVELIAEAKLQASTAAAEVTAGKATVADAVAVRSLQLALEDRIFEIDRQARRAVASLSRWVGNEADRPVGPGPDIYALGHHSGALDADLETHPHIAIFGPMLTAAETDLRLAQAATKPDWSLELSYAQRGSAYSNMVSVMVRMDLPIFTSRRQDPVALSKGRQVEQVRAQAEDARRRHSAEIRASLADWETAKSRVERYRGQIVPLAEERSRVASAAYEGARADLATVFDARRSLIEARLAAINAEAEVARAWAQLAFLLPDRTSP
jgi:outer membrane protein TolC